MNESIQLPTAPPADGAFQNMPYICARCYAMTVASWPHPEGAPCPAQAAVDNAYIAKLEAERAAAKAQRDYYERAQMPTLDMGETMRTMTKVFKRDLDEDDE